MFLSYTFVLCISVIGILFFIYYFNTRNSTGSYTSPEEYQLLFEQEMITPDTIILQQPIEKGNKYENECRRIIQSIYQKEFPKQKVDFIINPKTNRKLELDMYNPELKLALEYQGQQHRNYTPRFHKEYADFLKQIERDNLKKIKCKEHGVELICVPDTIKLNDLQDYIEMELKKRNRL